MIQSLRDWLEARFRAWFPLATTYLLGPPKPPLVYFDANGVGWCARPDRMEPWSEDVGQHDYSKREMRIFLWRWFRGLDPQPVMLDPADLGLGGPIDRVPRLLPLGQSLAIACQSLGFGPLARAAMPEASEEQLAAAYEAATAALDVEIERMLADNAAVQVTWDARYGPAPVVTREQIYANLNVGVFEPSPGVRGRVRAPLKPIQLRGPVLDGAPMHTGA